MNFRKVANANDLARLEAALRFLSADIGEDYACPGATLADALTGPHPAAHGLLALQKEQTLGAALYSPVFSTVRGAVGVYVSDLWISANARGQGLGTRLLAQVARAGALYWHATWIKLAVYDHSTASQQFYKRLGFEPATGMQEMRLDAAGMSDLIRGAT
ncbi:GNAT family N-acetyltransferase [Roseinatronobacter alkalisoli]|uniref:GNAT family N-acetyltransferase n=1 Tax=Roseinatronobacter alkalisoli TaxID=3028235 RepID=A0ABT5TEC8_9RHOB|nr:GNAT family N-acetyltransferase [Roseinatronobacter sp. HJB301]MDD7973070.1 GNAT family N-acetyltransferase [Roseinatronobacter sp. HJB301]